MSLLYQCTDNNFLVSDDHTRYGEGFARSTIRTAAHAFEPILIVVCNLIENDPTRVCRRRKKLQISCRLLQCDLCHLCSLDLSGVSLYHLFGATSELVTLRLPLHDRHMVLCNNSGAVSPTDVDWEQFNRLFEGEFLTCEFEIFPF